MASSLQRDAGKAVGVIRKFASSCVFFADVEGYTEMAAQLSIDDLCAFLVSFFNILDACITEFPALYKVETIGKGLGGWEVVRGVARCEAAMLIPLV